MGNRIILNYFIENSGNTGELKKKLALLHFLKNHFN
jgi:hypothetical protein